MSEENHIESVIESYYDNIDKSEETNIKVNEDIIIGIDLGTSNSCVGIWRNKNFECIPDENGNRTIPSMVAFTNRSKYIGYEAKNQLELNPTNVIYEIKRLMGRKLNDEMVQNDKEFISYILDEDEQGNVLVKPEIHNKKYTPEEISAVILIKLRQMASNYLKRDVRKAVVSVPAYFNDSQKQATLDACQIAGLEIVRLINEPTSAALAYGLMNTNLFNKINKSEDNDEEKEMNIIVYDLGGGTLDVSLVNICNGIFEVKACVGNSHLGGVDFDNKIMNYCLTYFKKVNGIAKFEGNINMMSLQKLKKGCENAKKLLSLNTQTTIAIKDFYQGKDLIVILTRDKLNQICRDLLIVCLKSLDDVLKSAEMNKDEVDQIILVGGMTRMPSIRENIKKFFNKEPNCSINPDEAIAMGASIQGYIISNKDDPFSESVTLLDVVPLSFGVETIGGVMNVLIPRNSVIPISRKKKYTTDDDYVTSVKVKIYEGERQMTKDNFFVGEFELGNLESAPRGIVKIEVKFGIDVNGIITVTAEDIENPENKNGITITGNKGRLTKEQINKLLEEAKESELKDKIERKKKQLYYEIDDIISNILININNDDFKLNEASKELIIKHMDEIYEWLISKKYYERPEDEYKEVLDLINKKYGTLKLKYSSDTNTIKVSSQTENIQMTTIYGNDEEDTENIEHTFEKIEDEEFGIEDIPDKEKIELKEIRSNLLMLCDQVFQLLTNNAICLEDDYKKELKDFIDDTLIWVHIQQKIDRVEFLAKINEVNDACNKIVDHYKKENKELFEENLIKKSIQSHRDELENLCYAIKSSLAENYFNISNNNSNLLEKTIDETLKWLLDVDVDHIDVSEEQYNEKINEINNLCNQLYQSMVCNAISVDFNRKRNIDNNSSNNEIFVEENMNGTNINDIKNKLNNNNE
jgi:molecular chaperone DnaK (HSP70)